MKKTAATGFEPVLKIESTQTPREGFYFLLSFVLEVAMLSGQSLLPDGYCRGLKLCSTTAVKYFSMNFL